MDSKPPGKPPPEAPTTKLKPKRKRRSPAVPWKKPKDMPRRPLSAYNIFFRHEREKMLKQGDNKDQKPAASLGPGNQEKATGIGFANLARTVGAKWKTLSPEEKAPFEMEAARERARYDSQMLGWRAEQEQKKARKAGGSQQMIDALTSGPALQAYAARFGAAQNNYPDNWFATDEPQQPSQASFDATSHLMGMQEHQQRAMMAQQQYQQGMPPPPVDRFFTMAGNNQGRGVDYMDETRRQFAQQQTAATLLGETPHTMDQKDSMKMPSSNKASLPYLQGDPGRYARGPGTLFELRGAEEPGPTDRPSVFEQRSLMEGASVGYPPLQRQFGEESDFTAGMIQQSFFRGAAGRVTFQQDQQELPRAPRIEHRSSIGTPYQYPNRPSAEHTHRMVRSQSFPSSTGPKEPSPEGTHGKPSFKLPSPDESIGKLSLDSRGGGLETPMSPWLQSPFPQQQAPHQMDSRSILMSHNMVPTPPQQNDLFPNLLQGDGFGVSRPLDEPPPTFPGEEEFQSIGARYYNPRLRHKQPSRPQQGPGVDETGGIRLREGMEAGFNETSTRQDHHDPSLSQPTFDAFGSRIDDDGMDFFSNLNLKFED